MPPAAEDPLALVARTTREHGRLAASAVVDGEPVTWAGEPDGVFQIGSVTKVLTALLLATHVVDGTLALDQPVGELVTDLPDPAARVTLEQLATHTSGLPRVPRELWLRWARRDPDPYADVDHLFLVESLRRTRLRRRRRPAYSNLGGGLLGHALARHAGTSYDATLRARVTGPLAMSATTTDPVSRPVGHRRTGRPYDVAWRFDALAGAGALWSTPADLQRFVAVQAVPPEGGLGDAVRLTQQTWVPGRRMDQCLGWLRLHGRGGALLWHNGGTAGYRSFVGVKPGRGGVVVLTDRDRSVDALGVRLADLVA